MADSPAPVIRDLPRIARLARQHRAENEGFRLYLKMQVPLSNQDLDTVVRETTEAVWQQIDCLTCGNCCRTLQIVVDDKDIRRLSARLKLSLRDFTQKYVAVAEDRVKHFIHTPCAFLGDDNRCSVYEDRPQACRDFPYLHNIPFRTRTMVMVENLGTCPIVFNVWESLKERFKPRRK